MTIQHCVYEHMMFGAEYLGEIETLFQSTTNRKWSIASRMVTCSMTLRMHCSLLIWNRLHIVTPRSESIKLLRNMEKPQI